MTSRDTLLDLDPARSAAGAVVACVHSVLDTPTEVADLSPEAYAALVADCARARARLQALELKLIAAADRASVATDAGLASTGAWVAKQTRADQRESARQATLARELDEGLPQTSAALSAGLVSTEHAAVIAAATRRLPAGLAAEQVATVEESLVHKARVLDPQALRRVARRALEAVERDVAKVDAHEDAQLVDEEHAARARTRLSLHDNRDGTVSGHFTVPTVAGMVLKKVLDAMTSPRRGRPGASAAQAGDTHVDRDWNHERGLAFTTLLEHLPTDHLTGKVAATVLVKLDLDTLRGQLRAAGLDTGDAISAAEARRLACGAGILPAVLDGASRPLDLGRTKRFFTEAQRVAGALQHTTCAADGCDVPYAWAEAHHATAWSHGGQSNLADLVPLCGFHHRRIHDPAYDHRRHGNGSLTFHRRT